LNIYFDSLREKDVSIKMTPTSAPNLIGEMMEKSSLGFKRSETSDGFVIKRITPPPPEDEKLPKTKLEVPKQNLRRFSNEETRFPDVGDFKANFNEEYRSKTPDKKRNTQQKPTLAQMVGHQQLLPKISPIKF